MRYKRIFLALTLAAVFSLLAIAIPASPALAAESIEVDPDEADIGDSVDVDGEDFDESTDTTDEYVDIYLSSENGDIDDIDDLDNYEMWSKRVDTDGEFSKSFRVPTVLDEGDDDEEVVGGTYYIYVTYEDEDDIEDYAELTITSGWLDELSPDSGPVGTEVEITGAYFSGNDDIAITFGDDEVDIESGDTDTDSDGDFTCTILVPASTAGDQTIAVEDEAEHTASASFTVEPEVVVSPTSGSAASEVTVIGTGFGGEQNVTVTFDGTRVATVKTSSVGGFTVTFDVPETGAGTYDIAAEDEDDNAATADFSVAAGVSLGTVTTEDSPGYVGMEMTMSGTGFLPSTRVTITYATEPVVVATTTSDASGEFSATFTIPPSESGTHTITASDGTNSLSSTFVMESTSPSIPSPLLPQMGVKAEQPVYFDWEDVEDSSGLTYTFQIASDADFTSIELEKSGLTSSQYTITEAEKLASTKKEAPYYWRVKAIDGASNESDWSGAGTFYVGFTFPGGSIHLWWGLGAAGAGALGYFLGKRKSYYY